MLVFLCMFLLMRGATESATVNAIMVLIKLGVLVLFVVIGFTAFDGSHFDNFFGAGIGGITAAAGTIFFSFIGLDAVATAGEEVKDPQRSLPRAIIGALIIVTTVYVLVALAGIAAKPVELLQHRGGAERRAVADPERRHRLARSGAPSWPPAPSSRSSRSRS